MFYVTMSHTLYKVLFLGYNFVMAILTLSIVLGKLSQQYQKIKSVFKYKQILKKGLISPCEKGRGKRNQTRPGEYLTPGIVGEMTYNMKITIRLSENGESMDVILIDQAAQNILVGIQSGDLI